MTNVMKRFVFTVAFSLGLGFCLVATNAFFSNKADASFDQKKVRENNAVLQSRKISSRKSAKKKIYF